MKARSLVACAARSRALASPAWSSWRRVRARSRVADSTSPEPASEAARRTEATAAAQAASSPGAAVIASARRWTASSMAWLTARVVRSTRSRRVVSIQRYPPPPRSTAATTTAASASVSRLARRSSVALSSAVAAAISAARARSSSEARYAVSDSATSPAWRGRASGFAARQRLARSISSGSAPERLRRACAGPRCARAAFWRTCRAEFPVKGGSPVRISQRIAPSENTSECSSSVSTSPRACSGGMYAGVPMTEPDSD